MCSNHLVGAACFSGTILRKSNDFFTRIFLYLPAAFLLLLGTPMPQFGTISYLPQTPHTGKQRTGCGNIQAWDNDNNNKNKATAAQKIHDNNNDNRCCPAAFYSILFFLAPLERYIVTLFDGSFEPTFPTRSYLTRGALSWRASRDQVSRQLLAAARAEDPDIEGESVLRAATSPC